jgi:hypothetical protein
VTARIATYRILLLVHHIIIHLHSKDPALVEDPSFFGPANLLASFHDVGGFGYSIQERETPAHLIVDLL